MRRWWMVAAAVILVVAALGLMTGERDRMVATLGLGRRVVLYFATPDNQNLAPEVRYLLPWEDTPLNRLKLLAEGPRDRQALAPVIPPGARPLSVRVENGVAVADFSPELVERHWGGTSGELMTVYGIVNTLAEVPGVQKVRITVRGQAVETLAGHVDLSEPLAADPTLVKAPPGSSPAGTGQGQGEGGAQPSPRVTGAGPRS